MEDAVTRIHAQQLVAATLYLGSRIVGDVMRRVLAHPNRVELRADGLPHTRENSERLRSMAARAVRQALGEAPAAVLATPDPRGGWRVHVAFAHERPPLQPWELTDLQQAWSDAQERTLGAPAQRPTNDDVHARQEDVERALGTLRDTQTRLFEEPSPDTREAFAAAVNRAQMASDRLRAALQFADPLQFDRTTHHDQLDFSVRLQGDEGMSLVDRDRLVRDTFARAAALPDPRELYVFLRPTERTERADEWHAHVSFNFRDTSERGPQHLHPASLGRSILTGATSVPPVMQPVAGTLVPVSVATIEVARPMRQALRESAQPDPAIVKPRWSLDPPAALLRSESHERVRR